MEKEESKRLAKNVVKNITIGLLDCFLGMIEGMAMMTERKAMYRAAYGYFDRKLTMEQIANNFRTLQTRGYIEIEKRNGLESIRFTNKAKLKVVDKIIEKQPNDKFYHFVSFDLPESLRGKRNVFRRCIKRMGFVQVQKSLWVCKKAVGKYVEMRAIELGISEYIVYLVASVSNIEKELPKILKNKNVRYWDN